METRKIIGICGRARSGKSTVGTYLKEKYDFKNYNLSDILVEIAKKKGIEPNKKNLPKIGNEIREKDGPAGPAKLLLSDIEKDKHDKLSVSGFRSPEEVDCIRNESDDFLLIMVKTKPFDRYERREEKELTKEEFNSRDESDIKIKGMGKVFDMADVVVENNGSIEELYERIDSVLEEWNFI